ncbi:MAG: thioredoxin fold domain-containing protein [Gammaproteobacteria bacterium]|nr:thioredoxin fold domain-containing protein [Gammaproteobacteria bacterium]
MMLKINHFSGLLTFTILCFCGIAVVADESLPEVEIIEVEDFSQLAEQARVQQKLIMLEVSATYCSYCLKLEEEIIKPMLRSGDYDARVLIRKFDIDGFSESRDFSGSPITSAGLAQRWGIKVTPTIIFLNGQNQEVSERILGVNSLDYFGGFVDNAIDLGLAAIR